MSAVCIKRLETCKTKIKCGEPASARSCIPACEAGLALVAGRAEQVIIRLQADTRNRGRLMMT